MLRRNCKKQQSRYTVTIWVSPQPLVEVSEVSTVDSVTDNRN